MSERNGKPKRHRSTKAEVARYKETILRLYRAGETVHAIADRLGWTHGRTSVTIYRMRGEGYDLPYRPRESYGLPAGEMARLRTEVKKLRAERDDLQFRLEMSERG